MTKHPPKRATVEQCEALRAALIHVGAVGRYKAIPRRDVLARCRLQLADRAPSADRVLREILATAPEYGIPLVSCNDGYYVATCAEDIEACIRDLRSRAGEMWRRIQALEALQPAVATPDGRLF
jgi:hypothetical protein